MCTLLKVLSQALLAIKMAFQAENIALIVMLFEKNEFAWTAWSSGIPLCVCMRYLCEIMHIWEYALHWRSF